MKSRIRSSVVHFKNKNANNLMGKAIVKLYQGYKRMKFSKSPRMGGEKEVKSPAPLSLSNADSSILCFEANSRSSYSIELVGEIGIDKGSYLRNAVATIESFSQDGGVSSKHKSLPFSQKLEKHFGYLSQKGTLLRLSDDILDNKVNLNIHPFNIKDNEQLNVDSLSLNIRFSNWDNDHFFGLLIPLIPGFDIDIAVKSYEERNLSSRKAVLLVEQFDESKGKVDFLNRNFGYSKSFGSKYKYIETNRKELYKVCTIGGEGLKGYLGLKLAPFALKEGEILNVEMLSVSYRKTESTKFIPPSKAHAEISIIGWDEDIDSSKPTMVGATDEFTTGCFEQEVNLIQPRPDNWYGLSEKFAPDLFFIESAWKGNNGSWQFRVANYANKPGNEIEQISAYSRDKSIPIVFWNKEDPVHHDKFMCSAKQADVIFTTDENMCDSYKQRTGNQKVYPLPFAAQPELHKPSPLKDRVNRACFAGSWYGNRHAERGKAMAWLLESAFKYGLDIYDRNFGTGIFPFPDMYSSVIKGSLPYKALCEKYSDYRVFLNVNSVTDSPTMFSRRVFELMACGTPIVSTYALGIEKLFESDAVWMVNSEQEAEEAIKTLLTDDKEWRRRSLLGIREVFSKHTYQHRMNYVLEKTTGGAISVEPVVEVIILASSQLEFDVQYKQYQKQTYSSKRCKVLLTGSEQSDLVVPQGMTVAHGHDGLNLTEGSFVAVFSSNYVYGSNYLVDLVNATRYQPKYDIWSKSLSYDQFEELDGYGCPATSLYRSKALTLNELSAAISAENNINNMVFVIDSDELSVAE